MGRPQEQGSIRGTERHTAGTVRKRWRPCVSCPLRWHTAATISRWRYGSPSAAANQLTLIHEITAALAYTGVPHWLFCGWAVDTQEPPNGAGVIASRTRVGRASVTSACGSLWPQKFRSRPYRRASPGGFHPTCVTRSRRLGRRRSAARRRGARAVPLAAARSAAVPRWLPPPGGTRRAARGRRASGQRVKPVRRSGRVDAR